MASVYHFVCDAERIISQIIEKDREFAELRNVCQHAALQIQRVWRGYCGRQIVRHLHAAATIIQKHFKGYLVRKNKDKYVHEYIEYRKMKYRNNMATRIQALWRGYWYRTRVLNFREQYATQKRIEQVNAALICRMRDAQKTAEAMDKEMAENACMDRVLYILFKVHHHLRTEQTEGIYSMHGSSEYSWLEKLLKNMKFTNYMKILRKLYQQTYQEPLEPKCKFKGRYAECEKAYYLRDRRNDSKEQPIKEPTFLQSKPFCFDPKIERNIETGLLTKGAYTPPVRDVPRSTDKTKHMSETDFDVTSKMVHPKLVEPLCIVDFWNRICEIHNIPEN